MEREVDKRTILFCSVAEKRDLKERIFKDACMSVYSGHWARELDERGLPYLFI